MLSLPRRLAATLLSTRSRTHQSLAPFVIRQSILKSRIKGEERLKYGEKLFEYDLVAGVALTTGFAFGEDANQLHFSFGGALRTGLWITVVGFAMLSSIFKLGVGANCALASGGSGLPRRTKVWYSYPSINNNDRVSVAHSEDATCGSVKSLDLALESEDALCKVASSVVVEKDGPGAVTDNAADNELSDWFESIIG